MVTPTPSRPLPPLFRLNLWFIALEFLGEFARSRPIQGMGGGARRPHFSVAATSKTDVTSVTYDFFLLLLLLLAYSSLFQSYSMPIPVLLHALGFAVVGTILSVGLGHAGTAFKLNTSTP